MDLKKVEQHNDPLQLMLSASSGKSSSSTSSSSPKKSEKALEKKVKKDYAKNDNSISNSKDYEVNLIHGFEDLITGAIICKKNKLHSLPLLFSKTILLFILPSLS